MIVPVDPPTVIGEKGEFSFVVSAFQCMDPDKISFTKNTIKYEHLKDMPFL